MFFCANPKCLFHIDVADHVWTYTIIPFPDPVRNISEEPPSYIHTTTREKHLWRNPEKGTKWFFCDVCHEAAIMIE